MKSALLILGVLMALTGLLWIGQGAGYVNWPASSFMISQTQWVYYGAGLAVAGVLLIGFTRR